MRRLSIAAGVPLAFGLLLVLASPKLAPGQTGLCTDNIVRNGRPPTADDAFTYMPAYGKPMIGRPATAEANVKNFSGRTDVTRAWKDDHRIVVAPSGDMAYEQGTMHMGYDEGGKRTEFDAVMLTVFKAGGGSCQMVALTMAP